MCDLSVCQCFEAVKISIRKKIQCLILKKRGKSVRVYDSDTFTFFRLFIAAHTIGSNIKEKNVGIAICILKM